ncbi:DUF2752 domain-containing protein [Mycobacterium sp. NPDC003449]
MAPDAALGGRTARLTAIGTGAAFVGGLAYIGLSDPHRPGFLFPPCLFKAATGWDCPACGGLRMTHDLLHGDIGAAVTDNAFALIGLPLLALWVLGRWRAGRPPFPLPAVVTIVVAVLGWTVVRNLPGFPLVPTMIGG